MHGEPCAHTPNDSGSWHLLDEHLKGTAERAGLFGATFGADEVCRALGWMHDAGKAHPGFQRYLQACHEGRPAPSAPHAAPSAKAACDALKDFSLASLAILGHHSGLPDPDDAKRLLNDADEEAVSAAAKMVDAIKDPGNDRPTPPEWASDPLSAEMLLRMCFSALVDADFLDTEAHFHHAKAKDRGDFPSIDWYGKRLKEHVTALADRATHSNVNKVRQEVLGCCRAKAANPPGAFRLTVPTGGGKTLAGLTFALDHAARHRMDRVIVAIPYTSIIDQTARVYSGVFGADKLLEHHSALEQADEGEGQTRQEYRRRLAAENWDCPLVVTTTVQLFESLFSNRPSKCRKLHNVANSVIILDEVQTLPVGLLLPVLDVLNQLVEHYRCTVVFCTATQPDYSGLGENVLTRAAEIVDDPKRHFNALRRVCYERLDEPVTHEEIAEKLDGERQVMCVLNSRPDAVRVASACRPGDGLYHLSTSMCPDHRKKVLEQVRCRLQENLPVRLVSSQVVEAGVDLDFPLVMRVVGPLDRIVQVAGRCNREGLLHSGRCIVFELRDSKAPKGPYRTGTELTRGIVHDTPERIDQPDVVARYFRDLYNYAGANQGKGPQIQEHRKSLHFRRVAEEFRLIDEDAIGVVVMRYDSERIGAILQRAAFTTPRDLFRQLAPFSVSVPVYRFRQWECESVVRRHDSGAWLYDGLYNDLYGIGIGSDPDPTDLIA